MKLSMNHKWAFILVLLMVAQVSFANVITGVAAIPDGYYDGVSGKKGADNILNALNTCISKDYNEISYKGLEPHYLKTDFYADTLWDMYSTCVFTYEDANNPQKQVCDGWNKEHVCCQSWLGSGPMVSDMFNVYPTDARINNLRSNYPYGVVSSFSGFDKDPEKHGLGKLGPSVAGIGTVYQPDDRYKGDFARTFFYMVARYRSNILNSGNGSQMFTSNPTNLTSYALNFLLQWHRDDPVSEKEIDRNQAVYGEQNNRNPFIDYPELVEYIWGNKVGQAVDLSTMVPTCDTYHNEETIKYGVTWMVNGQVLKVDSVLENKKPTLPATPISCSATSDHFVAWTTSSIAGISQTAPAVLYASAAEMPAVKSDQIYHAVFAQADQQQGQGAVTGTQEFSSFSRGNAVTTVQAGNVTITFNKGSASNAATYYTEVRCYGGSTIVFSGARMTKIEFGVGANDKGNALKPNTGKMTTAAIWEGDATNVTFTVDGESGYRGISYIKVTYEDNTIVYVYSDYLTSCGTSDIEEIDDSLSSIRKIIMDGQLYIEVNGQLFTITGQRIK